MVAEVIFAGGRIDSIVPVGTVTQDAGSAATRDTAYADMTLNVGTSSSLEVRFVTAVANLLSSTTVVTGETLWCHLEFYGDATTSTTAVAAWVVEDSSGFQWFRCINSSSTIMQWQYNSGTGASPVWTNVGTTWDWTGQTRYAIDLKLTLGSPHSFEFSVAGSLQASGTFTQALFTNAAKFRIHGMGTAGTQYSQLLCTRDLPTIGAKVKYCRATAVGANTGWAGAYTDINEQLNSDSTAQSAASAALKSTHAMGDVTVPSGSEIVSVFHWLRGKNDGTSPNNIKSVLRSGGVDYSTGNLNGIGTSFGAIGARYDADPATSSNWTQAGWNAAEAGFESAA